jgi:hypothetical protein
VLLFVRPSNAGFEATLRTAAYASVTALVSWIPVLGQILALYGIYLAVVGIREMHRTTTGRAALVVLIPTLIIFMFALIFIVLVGAALFSSRQQHF